MVVQQRIGKSADVATSYKRLLDFFWSNNPQRVRVEDEIVSALYCQHSVFIRVGADHFKAVDMIILIDDVACLVQLHELVCMVCAFFPAHQIKILAAAALTE